MTKTGSDYMYTSVRAINKAVADSALGRAGEGPRVKRPEGLLQISRARMDSQGFLSVRLVATGEWVECDWGDVVKP